jgi:hypothetical protein
MRERIAGLKGQERKHSPGFGQGSGSGSQKGKRIVPKKNFGAGQIRLIKRVMHRLLTQAAFVGLTMSALNLQAQIKAGPSGMPSSLAYSLEYSWEKTTPNFLATNPATVANAGAPAADITTDTGAGTRLVQHFEAVPIRPVPPQWGPDATAARGGAYQQSYTPNGVKSYNHDGLAFANINGKLNIALLAHDAERTNGYQKTAVLYDYTSSQEGRAERTKYYENVKSGKWRKFKNGEG